MPNDFPPDTFSGVKGWCGLTALGILAVFGAGVSGLVYGVVQAVQLVV